MTSFTLSLPILKKSVKYKMSRPNFFSQGTGPTSSHSNVLRAPFPLSNKTLSSRNSIHKKSTPFLNAIHPRESPVKPPPPPSSCITELREDELEDLGEDMDEALMAAEDQSWNKEIISGENQEETSGDEPLQAYPAPLPSTRKDSSSAFNEEIQSPSTPSKREQTRTQKNASPSKTDDPPSPSASGESSHKTSFSDNDYSLRGNHSRR